jgi:hypothetical protein
MIRRQRLLEAVDLLLAVVYQSAAPASVDARLRMLDAAIAEVEAIRLPDTCTTFESEPPSS